MKDEKNDNPLHKRLGKNTLFLYLLTFSNQILALAVVPYLTRVLGPAAYGDLGVALSIMTYVQLILDLGFIFSATEIVSNDYNNNNLLCRIFSMVSYTKICVQLILGVLLYILCYLISTWRPNTVLYSLFYLAYGINSLLPDYIYRGKEQMGVITIRTVTIKVLFTFLIFLLIKDSGDILLYPIILLVGNLIAVIWSWIHIWKEYQIHFVSICNIEWKQLLKKTFPFFTSRLASTFYQALNILLLGCMYPGQAIVGYYSSVDKLLSVVKSISSPLADSLYPYMMKNKDYKLIYKILSFSLPMIGICVVLTLLFAEKICVILFGNEYRQASMLLRCMVPAMAVIFPTYILCFPVLVPMGLSKYANFSNILGAILQIFFLLILYITKNMSAMMICITSALSEMCVFIFRFGIVMKYKRKT